jgi:hypothetical protein
MAEQVRQLESWSSRSLRFAGRAWLACTSAALVGLLLFIGGSAVYAQDAELQELKEEAAQPAAEAAAAQP